MILVEDWAEIRRKPSTRGAGSASARPASASASTSASTQAAVREWVARQTAERFQGTKMPPIRAVRAGGRHDHVLYFFLPWVLLPKLVTSIFAGPDGSDAPRDGRHWSSVAVVGRLRTAQRRPSGCLEAI